jgi:hypothetical protein
MGVLKVLGIMFLIALTVFIAWLCLCGVLILIAHIIRQLFKPKTCVRYRINWMKTSAIHLADHSLDEYHTYIKPDLWKYQKELNR